MSKIYEALLRAEQERAAAAEANPAAAAASAAVATAAPAAPVVATPAPAPAAPAPVYHLADPVFPKRIHQPEPKAEPAFEAVTEYVVEEERVAIRPAPAVTARAAPVVKPAAKPVSGPVASGFGGPLDFNKIRLYEWKPSFQQLPALQLRGTAVEQFRSLRSRMQEFRDLNTLKSILVSSGLPQEGKSFVTANLALSFAQHKASRVLLIDGDMRRASLHNMLGAHNKPGLSEYLAGTATLLEVMQRGKSANGKPLPPGLASLTFIGGGSDSDKAADLSGNHRFAELIEAASPHYDWIIVDSSPVNLVTDGVNLARSCDGVLLITRGGVTKYKTAQRALSELKASKILGVVLNAVEKSVVAAGYYGYDDYENWDGDPETPVEAAEPEAK